MGAQIDEEVVLAASFYLCVTKLTKKVLYTSQTYNHLVTI